MSIANLELIEKSLRLEEGVLKAAIENEEDVDIEIGELVILTKEDHDKREANIIKREEEVKKNSKDVGVEMAIKQVRNDRGLDFEGKTMDNLLAAVEAKVLSDAKIAPDKKISELEGDIKQMRTNFQQEQEKTEGLQERLNGISNDSVISNQLTLGDIDSGNLNLSKSRIDSLFLAENKIEVREGIPVGIDNSGDPIKDKTTLDLIPVSDLYQDFAKTFVKQTTGGAGLGNEGGKTGEGTYDSFKKEMETQGINEGSEKFAITMNERLGDGTLKV